MLFFSDFGSGPLSFVSLASLLKVQLWRVVWKHLIVAELCFYQYVLCSSTQNRLPSSHLLGAFAAMSALLQIDDFMLSQHSQAAKE